MTIDEYKAQSNYRLTVSLDRCQFCDNFVRFPKKEDPDRIAGHCKVMRKQVKYFDTTSLGFTCDNYVNEKKNYL